MEFVVGVVFLAAAVVKLADLKGTFNAFEEHWLKDRSRARALALGVMTCELSLGMLLVLGWWAYPALMLSLAILIVFTGALLLSLAQHKPRACACFGTLSNGNITWKAVTRNLVLVAFTAFLILSFRSRPLFFEIAPLWKGALGLGVAVSSLIVMQLIDSEKRLRAMLRRVS